MMIEKLIGETAWVQPGDTGNATVKRAIVRDQSDLAIDLLFEGRDYNAVLKRQSGNSYSGKYSSQWNGQPYEGVVSCRLFRSEDGIFLFGDWQEDGENHIWWADLEVVE